MLKKIFTQCNSQIIDVYRIHILIMWVDPFQFTKVWNANEYVDYENKSESIPELDQLILELTNNTLVALSI